jgi:hypothetical protein
MDSTWLMDGIEQRIRFMMEMRGLRESMGPMSHGVSVVKNDKQIAPNFCTNSYVETCFLGKLFSTKTQQCCFAENKKRALKMNTIEASSCAVFTSIKIYRLSKTRGENTLFRRSENSVIPTLRPFLSRDLGAVVLAGLSVHRP